MEVSAPAGVLRSPGRLGKRNRCDCTGIGLRVEPPPSRRVLLASLPVFCTVECQGRAGPAWPAARRALHRCAVTRRSRKQLQCPVRVVCGSSPAGARSACAALGPLHPGSANLEHEGTASLLVYTSVEQTLVFLILYQGGRKGRIAFLLPSVSGVNANECFVSGVF